ncbi:GAF and ANTAR domain-containing protein [uncultured Friedmanniella sp.]|uniref:GAF and ANTAR domain-containing protein n=1 Tax=uncultured Friedmanniella sp. TaxID=335381 RepID=UPI0035CA57DE
MVDDRSDGVPAQDHPPTGLGQVAGQMGEIARSMQGHGDTHALLDDIVSAAVSLIPGVDEGSVSIVTDRRTITPQNPSGELPRIVDALQSETGEGPCLDAVYEQGTVHVPDMASEQRWLHFAPRAAAAGAASMLSFQLYVEGDNLGALNLYARTPHAFDEDSEQVGLLFATHAAVALASAQQRDNLTRGVATRDLIGQAKGILMERYRIDSQRAFLLLSRASQQSQVKLRTVAEQLSLTGELPAGTKPHLLIDGLPSATAGQRRVS